MAEPADFITRAIADVLTGAYKKARLSREDLAARTGISKSSIDRYMQGKLDMSAANFARIATAIGRPADELYAEALADAERMSEGAAQNEDPRNLTVDELEARRRNRSLATAADSVDPESTIDEPDEP